MSESEAVPVEERIASQPLQLCERSLDGSVVLKVGVARHKLNVAFG
ncbi:hypothetical protein LJR186_000225 [Microbacterium foliorum]